jgi:hypothetical protein
MLLYLKLFLRRLQHYSMLLVQLVLDKLNFVLLEGADCCRYDRDPNGCLPSYYHTVIVVISTAT